MGMCCSQGMMPRGRTDGKDAGEKEENDGGNQEEGKRRWGKRLT